MTYWLLNASTLQFNCSSDSGQEDECWSPGAAHRSLGALVAPLKGFWRHLCALCSCSETVHVDRRKRGKEITLCSICRQTASFKLVVCCLSCLSYFSRLNDYISSFRNLIENSQTVKSFISIFSCRIFIHKLRDTMEKIHF